ncbi:S8 family serine peptidase, partial [Candidatus Kaiserbacteria bacterium]|nr:S8 family serine peptidase [Candidatus Kaiserbacteria bacterium]
MTFSHNTSRIFWSVVFAFLMFSPAAFAHASERIIVGYRDDAAFTQGVARFGSLSLTDYSSIPQIHTRVFNVPDGASVQAIKDALSQDSSVSYVEVDRQYKPSLIPNDPCYAGSNNPSATCPASYYFPLMGFPSAWDSTTGTGVTIAILDTGVDCAAADLSGQCVAGRDVVGGVDISATSNSDDNSHGTGVASDAAAIGNNATQITGAAFGAKIMPIKITAPGASVSNSSDIATGVVWAADHGVKVANLSFGGLGASDFLLENAAGYLRSKGGILFQAAGNDSSAFSQPDVATVTIVGAT